MKKNRIYGLAAAAFLLGAAACSNDMIDPNKSNPGQLAGDNGMGGVYMTVDFKLPGGSDGTRSETTGDGGSTGGEEVGTDAENNVTSALIVLAFDKKDAPDNESIKDYGYIVSGEVHNNHIAYVPVNSSTDNSKLFEASAKLSKENLNTFYGMFFDEEKQTYNVPPVYVFVFCNPTLELRQYFAGGENGTESVDFGSADWLEKTCTVIQHNEKKPDQNIGIWGSNSFLMNNKTVTKRQLPENLLDWENYNSYDKAFHLSNKNESIDGKDPIDNGTEGRGAVLVERSVARFDFKDGSELDENRYNVLFATDDMGTIVDKAPIVGVQLQKMCLVNMSNNFFYVPRVSKDGQLNGPDYEICGREKPWKRNINNGTYDGGNYVVGPYAKFFNKAAATFGYEENEDDGDKPPFGDDKITLGEKPLSEYFNFPFFDDNGLFNTDFKIGSKWDVVKIDDILNNGNKDLYDNKSEYNVWRYVTENIIPTIPDQVNGISTGVIFKAKMIPAVGTPADIAKYDEYWAPGAYQNLINCLSGKKFTFNGDPNHILQGNSKDDPILYYKDGQLYMGWKHIRQAAIQESITRDVKGELEINRNTSLYQAVFGDGPIPTGMKYLYQDADKNLKEQNIVDPDWKDDVTSAEYQNYLKSANYAWIVWSDGGKNETIEDEDTGTSYPALEAMREAVTGAGITIYQSSTDMDYNDGAAGYYCYYYYWNRHNDNGFNGSMGPMEFDVVRNNVYKLSVDKVSRLGHPRIPSNDPNKPDPGTKDESDDIYLDVSVRIAPWVVRLNSIQF